MRMRQIFAGLILAIGIVIPNMLSAPNVEAAEKLTCLDDYYSFIGSARDDATKRHYFSDLFTLSYCQINDILDLEDELDSVRDSLRSAAVNCESTTTYKEKYVELLMEEYFVRNVQKRDPGVLDEGDAAIIEASKDKILAELYTDMYNVFVTDLQVVNKSTMKSYFAAWSYEYDDRIGQYVRCDEGALAELNQTLTDFRDTLSDIKEGWHIEVKKETSIWEKLYSPVDEKIVTPVKNAFASWKEARDKAQQEKVTELGADDSFEQAISQFDIDAALNTLSDSELERGIQEASIDRMKQYRLLYGEGGSLDAYNMQGILQKLNQVIDDSNNKDLPEIQNFVEKIEAKQCAE